MGVFVFAGSSQPSALPLIAAAAPMWVILATFDLRQPALRRLQRHTCAPMSRTCRSGGAC